MIHQRMQPDTQLEGWKQIAEYLDRDVSTVMRWQHTRKLPVHRLPGSGRASVYTTIGELEAWRAGSPVDDVNEQMTESGAEPASVPERLPQNIKRFGKLAGLLCSAVLVLTLTGVMLFTAGANREPVRFVLDNDALVAFDEQGKTVWRAPLPQPLAVPLGDESWRVTVADIEPAPGKEVIAAAGFRPPPGGHYRSVVFCYSRAGQLLWRYEPEFAPRYGGRTFEAPWAAKDMRILATERGDEVWIAWVHNTWWPSFVTRLRSSGKATIAFLHPGWILALLPVSIGQERIIVLGGITNEYGSPFVAVISGMEETAICPPVVASRFQALDCSATRPLKYVVMPQTELSRLTGSRYDSGMTLRSAASHFTVVTNELVKAGGLYTFSQPPAFSPLSFALEHSYWNTHQALELEGKLTHPASRCVNREARLKVWDGVNGWGEAVLKHLDY
jgi:hypothetical protein